MAATHRAPKQWCLTKIETVNSFENWRQNLLYTLSLDVNFAPFLRDGFQWDKKSRTHPYRGLKDDGSTVPSSAHQTKEQKTYVLELMLGQIANYCPVISRNTIMKNSTSVENIWQTIRLHYGFQSTGAHFLDFANIKLENSERPEDLYQRLMAFVEDSLLSVGCGITHLGEPAMDEDLTPALENFVVLTWLHLVHPDLPKLVKQRYGTELRSRTLASVKAEISQAMESLLEELQSTAAAQALRTSIPVFGKSAPSTRAPLRAPGRPRKSCILCKEAHCPDFHFLSRCPYLPSSDKQFFAKARTIQGVQEASEDTTDNSMHEESVPSHAVQRIQIRQSPYLDAFYGHLPVRLTIDSGATGNMIRSSFVSKIGAKITASSQSAHQADGSSLLHVVGETRITLSRDGHELYFEGLVVENLDTDILAGIPFMERNDVAIRPSKRLVTVKDSSVYAYGHCSSSENRHAVRYAHVLRFPQKDIVWPGNYVELPLPSKLSEHPDAIAVEPHGDHIRPSLASWPAPSLLDSVGGKIRIPNLTSEPVLLKRHEHICRIRSTFVPDPTPPQPAIAPSTFTTTACDKSCPFSSPVRLDPDNILPKSAVKQFQDLLLEYDEVFNPSFPGYNGDMGPFMATVNMGSVQPPQQKGRVPQYSRNLLNELHAQFDELEALNVFRKPEDVPVNIEYVNPSFLVKKPSGGFRLVTAFADVGRYSKPQPSLLPDVDSTLRLISQWQYIIAIDLTKAFYQIPLSKDSMKYCGVVTPFKGVRVYNRSAMGMPGSETDLEELTCRGLGDLVAKGHVAKVADDLYCGADTWEDLLQVWSQVLSALQRSDLRLSAAKTVIAPRQTSILGWHWCLGTLRANSHRVATLASCPPPQTVTGLRSFIGAYKVLSRVIKGASQLLSPLDDAIAGCESKASIHWTDALLASFCTAQSALSDTPAITLPRPSDQLWIVTEVGQAKVSMD